MRILAICGSLQARSSNLALLEIAIASTPPGVEMALFDGLRDLPQFNPDLEADGPLPIVQTWRRALADSDALFIASPEYAFSLPGALKNGIDWVVGTAELERKIVALTASVNHPERGVRGLKALKDTLSAVSATIVGAKPTVRGPTFESDVAALIRATVAAVEARRREERGDCS